MKFNCHFQDHCFQRLLKVVFILDYLSNLNWIGSIWYSKLKCVLFLRPIFCGTWKLRFFVITRNILTCSNSHRDLHIAHLIAFNLNDIFFLRHLLKNYLIWTEERLKLVYMQSLLTLRVFNFGEEKTALFVWFLNILIKGSSPSKQFETRRCYLVILSRRLGSK